MATPLRRWRPRLLSDQASRIVIDVESRIAAEADQGLMKTSSRLDRQARRGADRSQDGYPGGTHRRPPSMTCMRRIPVCRYAHRGASGERVKIHDFEEEE